MEVECSVGGLLMNFEEHFVTGTECKCFMFRSRRAAIERRLGCLVVLAEAVTSKDSENSECVLLSDYDPLWIELNESPQNVFCRLWRWPQLETDCGKNVVLRKLPFCPNKSSTLTCCNPYHWSRLKYPGLFLCLRTCT